MLAERFFPLITDCWPLAADCPLLAASRLVPGRLFSGSFILGFDLNTAGIDSHPGEIDLHPAEIDAHSTGSPSHSTWFDSQSAGFYLTRFQSSVPNSAEPASVMAESDSNLAELQLTYSRPLNLLSSLITPLTLTKQVNPEKEEEEWRGVPAADHGSPVCGFSSGNRITSRIDFAPVRIIVSRSTPNPSPAVGGKPYASALT